MTSKNIFNKIATKLIWILTVLCMLCSLAFLFTACDDSSDSSTTDEPTYSYSEKDDKLISNGSFNIGTANLDFTTISSLPRISVTGWSKTSSDSDVNSGVIDVSDAGWEALIGKLYDDSDFLTYAKYAFGIDKNDAIALLEEDGNESPTSQEIKDKYISEYLSGKDDKTNYFPNPGKPESSTDNKIYMLNNYDKDGLGLGTYQSITSSSSINLEKGQYGKFTVSIKTIKDYLKGFNDSVDYGAYIAVNNSFASNSQAQYRIENIKTNGEWKEYTIYVKADKIYDTTVTLVLGLGVDKYSPVEGTAYFDGIKFDHITEKEYADGTADIKDTQYLTYGYTNKAVVAEKNVPGAYLYDMTLDKYLANSETKTTNNVKNYKTAVLGPTVKVEKTVSNTGTGNNFGPNEINKGTTTVTDLISAVDSIEATKATLSNESYTLSYLSNNFKVAPEQYVYVEFYVKNQLSKFGSTAITFDVYEHFSSDISSIELTELRNSQNKNAAVASLSEISDDWVKVGLMINNNFTTGDRYFFIDIVIGPTDVAAATTAPDYANGTVTITNPLISSGKIAQYNEVGGTKTENENYQIYSLLKSKAAGSLALYAGMQQDFTEDSSSESFSLRYSASDIGAILTRPVTPSEYTGVVSDHVYMKDNSEITAINDRETVQTGSFAGLINTEYANSYKLSGINDALGFVDGDDHIQPLMIYNAEKDSYGYISSEKTITSGSYAKISIDVRVVGDAVAYIYLVDTSDRTIMTFDSDNVVLNTAKEFFFKVDKNMMNDDGWTTISFYLATGLEAKNFRLELWNGDRSGLDTLKSQGFIFFNNVSISTSGAFTEPTNIANAFTVSGNPLYDIGKATLEDSIVQHTRELTDLEKQFNDEQTDSTKKVSYNPTIIWANDSNNIYAIFNTIDPIEVDPYASESEDDTEEDTSSGCIAETDPATFWLSFSSILLGVVLVLAMIMLVIKKFRRRRKANAGDAKVHYKVVSRSRIYKPTEQTDTDLVESNSESDEIIEDQPTMSEDDTIETENTEQTEDYIYGEVQDFGDDE